MRSSRQILMLLLVCIPLAGCGSNKNSACEACTNDEDCESGLTCQPFREDPSGNIFTLCGDANPAMTCPHP